MQTQRANHTMTLLPSGKVLIAGGSGAFNNALNSAELYDGLTGITSATGSMAATRAQASATLLPDGNVLVAGGGWHFAELYYPRSGQWITTGAASTDRFGHTATLLRNGSVLVVGGTDASGAGLASAELYNPTTQQWTSTATLATPRYFHTATLLPNGQVLVAGGSDSAPLSCELYDPVTAKWSSTGSLLSGHRGGTATLLPNGRVVIAGGRDTSNVRIGSAEIYDVNQRSWIATSSMTTARTHHTAILLPTGQVLVVGGTSQDAYLASAELYNPAQGTWNTTGSLSLSRVDHRCILLPTGEVLATGGRAFSVLKSAERYRLELGVWSAAASLAEARTQHTATLMPDGRVLVAGGFPGSSSAEVFDPGLGTWTSTQPLPMGRYFSRATLLQNGLVLLTGGVTGDDELLSSAVLYDPVARSWSATGSLRRGRTFHTATLLADGRVLVAGGGWLTGTLDSCEIFDPSTGLWTQAAAMSVRRTGHTATLLTGGRVLVTGGYGGSGFGPGGAGILDVSELYDPWNNTWTTTGSLIEPRSFHTANLLSDGCVLVAGGYGADALNLGSAEVYQPASGTWLSTGQLSAPASSQTSTLLSNGKVLIAGGFDDQQASLTSAGEYDPSVGDWRSISHLPDARGDHTATLLPSGNVLLTGGHQGELLLASATRYIPRVSLAAPTITSVSSPVRYGAVLTVTGVNFGSALESGGGNNGSSATNYPIVMMRSVESGQAAFLIPDSRSDFSVDPMTLTFSELPPSLDPGWNLLTVTTNGVSSASKLVRVECTAAVITSDPEVQLVAVGEIASFSVKAQGARSYQWFQDGVAIPGATSSGYSTAPVKAADAGSQIHVVAFGACGTDTSALATLAVIDTQKPEVALVAPTGGEYWLLSETTPRTQVVAWKMSDNIRVCRVETTLIYSNDAGASWSEAPPDGGLPRVFGSSGTCAHPGETTSSLTYTVPDSFPSGRAGSLYKIHVRVTDQAGNTTVATSPNPFHIVRPNPDSVLTLILWNRTRMIERQRIGTAEAEAISSKLHELANHPRVQGVVDDLSSVTSLATLYAAWDAQPENAGKSNAVLFSPGGIHEHLRSGLIRAYSGVKYVVLVGDDRIIPMARIRDGTVLWPEARYANGVDLSATASTVGQALAQNLYLTDDPLATLDAMGTGELDASLHLPDLAIGRLVETPAEIITTIATYIGQDGILDVSDDTRPNKVLVTGYDWLSNVAKQMQKQWTGALGEASVDATLVDGTWGLGSVSERVRALRTRLSGRFGIMAVAGHGTHYEEGVPGTNPFDIQGLPTVDLYGADACGTPSLGAVDLSGSVIYAVGCHGGLPVQGSCANPDRLLDLPQTMLSRGAVALVANTGYGWGLKHGIGYGTRLVQIFTERMAAGGTIAVGEAVRQSKHQYYLEAPRYDPYDEKTLMQWTLFGLPMYAVKVGTPAHVNVARTGAAGDARERVGRIHVKRSLATRPPSAMVRQSALPTFLTQLNLSFDFTAEGVYDKHDSAGNVLVPKPGCSDPNGCYYTLNGLVDRGTGSADVPIQPYLIYDSGLAGTSQHGVLWKGGTYTEESGWTPVIAELISNGGDGSNHGSAPRHVHIRPTTPRIVPGIDAPDCRMSDLEINSLTLTAGEAAKNQDSDPIYSIARLYRAIDLEVYYFNNRSKPADNCDRVGPAIAFGPYGGQYHYVTGSTVSWAIPAADTAGVWRVVVVYNLNTVDSQGRGSWVPLELTDDGTGTFRGMKLVNGSTRLTYMVQAVDNRGNVTWLDYVSTQLPASGVPLGVPNVVDVFLGNSDDGRRRAVRH